MIDNQGTISYFKKNRVVGNKFDQYSVEISVDSNKNRVYTKLYKDNSFTDLVLEMYDDWNCDDELSSYAIAIVKYYEEKSYDYGKELYEWSGQVEA